MLVKIEIITTADSSKTLRIPELDEQYHSKHGALTEAMHVYIKAGCEHRLAQMGYTGELSIFELGFGTGMNAALTADYMATFPEVKCTYTVIEPLVLSAEQYGLFAKESWAQENIFLALHQAQWSEMVKITDNFTVMKHQTTFEAFEPNGKIDLIYYDAFGPRVQAELWEPWALQKCADFMTDEAIWVSYCAKGSVRRGLQEAGLTVERMPGPPGKREMIRATKKATK